MLQINIDDVLKIVNLCVPYLIGLAVVIAAAVIVMVACRKKKSAAKYLIRRQGLTAILLAFCYCGESDLLGSHVQPDFPCNRKRNDFRRDFQRSHSALY